MVAVTPSLCVHLLATCICASGQPVCGVVDRALWFPTYRPLVFVHPPTVWYLKYRHLVVFVLFVLSTIQKSSLISKFLLPIVPSPFVANVIRKCDELAVCV